MVSACILNSKNGNREVKSSQSKGIGIPLILRAFLRVFSAMSLKGAMLVAYFSCFAFSLTAPLG